MRHWDVMTASLPTNFSGVLLLPCRHRKFINNFSDYLINWMSQIRHHKTKNTSHLNYHFLIYWKWILHSPLESIICSNISVFLKNQVLISTGFLARNLILILLGNRLFRRQIPTCKWMIIYNTHNSTTIMPMATGGNND